MEIEMGTIIRQKIFHGKIVVKAYFSVFFMQKKKKVT